MAAVSLFWNTNVAAVTSCENGGKRLMGSSGLLVRIQDGDEQDSAARIKGNFAATLDRTENNLM